MGWALVRRVLIRWIGRGLLVTALILASLPNHFVALTLLLSVIHVPKKLMKQVVLPNGMTIKRAFDIDAPEMIRHDLYAPDGRTLLSKGPEFICFNDRYTQVDMSGALFDAQTGTKVPEDDFAAYIEIYRASDISHPDIGCNGYYTAHLGPSMLFEDSQPFKPSCYHRNLDNPNLKNREWLDRSCNPEKPPPGWSMPRRKKSE